MLSSTRNQQGIDLVKGIKLTGLNVTEGVEAGTAVMVMPAETIAPDARPVWDYTTFTQQSVPVKHTTTWFYKGSVIGQVVAFNYGDAVTDQDFFEFLPYELYVPTPDCEDTWITTRIARWEDLYQSLPQAISSLDNEPINMYLADDTFGIKITAKGDPAVVEDFFDAIAGATFFTGADMKDVLIEVFFPDQWRNLVQLPKRLEGWEAPFMFCILRTPSQYTQFLDFVDAWKQARKG